MTGGPEPSVFSQEILVKFTDRYVSMFVRIWKPAGNVKGSVFCIHEFVGNGRDFDFLAAFLCSNGYQVICPDIVGRGRSAFLRDAADYDVELYNQCLRALSEFGSNLNYFIGSSWGGIALLLAWSLAPWKVAKLILVDPPMVGSPVLDEMRDRILSDSELTFDTRVSAEAHVLASTFSDTGADSAVARKFAANRVAEVEGRYRLAFDPAAAGKFAALRGRSFDLFPIAAQINAPILLVHTRDNAVLDRAAIDRYEASRQGRWTVETTPGSPSSLMRLDQALMVLGFLSAA